MGLLFEKKNVDFIQQFVRFDIHIEKIVDGIWCLYKECNIEKNVKELNGDCVEWPTILRNLYLIVKWIIMNFCE